MGRCLLVLLLLVLLGGCSTPLPPRVAAPPPQDPDAQCLADLARLPVAFERVEPFGDTGDGCGIGNPVRVSVAHAPLSQPAVMSCQLARSLTRFEADVVEPLARRYLGQGIKRVIHAGTYNCRTRRTEATTQPGMGSRGGKLSEHAKGRAVDVMGFELADGTTVSVKHHWRGAGSKSSFLQDVAAYSCDMFSVVLTPESDRLHADHFHLDVGPWRKCGR